MEPMDELLTVKEGAPESFGWLRRKDLDCSNYHVWERDGYPSQTLCISGVTLSTWRVQENK